MFSERAGLRLRLGAFIRADLQGAYLAIPKNGHLLAAMWKCYCMHSIQHHIFGRAAFLQGCILTVEAHVPPSDIPKKE